MILESHEPHQAIFALPLRRPSFLPPTTLRLRITALRCGAVRITRTMRDAFLDQDSDTVTDRTPGSCAVGETEEVFQIDCGSLKLLLDKRTGSLTFLDPSGQVLLREDPKRPCVLEEKPVMINRFDRDAEIRYTDSIDGVRASSDAYQTVEDRRAYACKLAFRFDPEEGLYGLGSHEEGYGNLRGRCRELYQHNMKAVVPVLVSTRGWGILFDLGGLATFHDDAEGSYLWADCVDEMDYYFMAGGYESVCRQYRALTGAAPMLPRYAFGYVQSKERYKDANELLDVVQEYRRLQVPLDVIVLDWQSWPNNQWGYKVFDPERFPDPQALTDTLHDLGAHMMISIWPSMQGDENANRSEMLENNCMLGNRTIYNAFDPKARALYWKQAEEGLFRYGVDAWWCDCSEPFEADWHGAIKPEPFERTRINTEEAKKYLDPGKISLYSLFHSMGIYQGQRASASPKRVLNLTRSSWAGQHRYATVTWSGDVCSTWETLRRQIPEGLNFMATGEAFWSTDAGGFFPMNFGGAWFGTGDFNGGVDDPGYRELYVRWLQFAAFLPMMRSHGTGTPREIWQFGKKGSPWYDAIEKIIRFRSALVPFLYSLAAAYSSDGIPMVRIPALVFPEDPALRKIDDQMMVGDQLLVKPVTWPMQYLPNAQPVACPDDTVTVTLPAGTDWYAWGSATPIPGGQVITTHAPLDTVPLFVRAGSIIVTGPVRQHVGERAYAPLSITVYPGADGRFVLYDDAGDGYEYEKGEWARVTLAWNDSTRELTVFRRAGDDLVLSLSEMRISLPGGPETLVTYRGKEITVRL